MAPPSCIKRLRKKNDVVKALAAADAQSQDRRLASAGSSLVERESNLERHLPMIDLAVLDVSSGFGHLKPTHVADGLFSACQRIFYRLLKSVGRRTNHFNFLINMIRHRLIISSRRDQTQLKACLG